MKTTGWLLPLAGLLAASVAMAQVAPDRSLRPQLRAGSGAAPASSGAAAARAASTVPLSTTTSDSAGTSAVARSLRPSARKGGEANTKKTTASTSSTTAVAAGSAAAVAAVTPKARESRKTRKKSKSGGLFAKRKLRKTSVCGDIALQGEKIGNVPGAMRGCGVQDAVRVRSVSGIALSTPAVMNCQTAQALRTWVDDGLVPAFKRRGKVVELKVAAHYACRTRNNKRGARISEHGKGRAIDISAFTMKDGQVYTVKESWWRGRGKKPLQKAYKAACGPFGTTLGPTADRYHQDHFHFDTASYRSGPYCK